MPSFETTGLWWLWIATTLPITMITVLSWWFYKKHKESAMRRSQPFFKGEVQGKARGTDDGARKESVFSMPRRRKWSDFRLGDP